MAVSQKPPLISAPGSQDHQECNTSEDAANDDIADITRLLHGTAEHEVKWVGGKVCFVIVDLNGLVCFTAMLHASSVRIRHVLRLRSSLQRLWKGYRA